MIGTYKYPLLASHHHVDRCDVVVHIDEGEDLEKCDVDEKDDMEDDEDTWNDECDENDYFRDCDDKGEYNGDDIVNYDDGCDGYDIVKRQW